MEKTYDLVIIGAGSGGLSAASFAVEVGATVALIDKTRLGGDCTWTGCVPSKSLLHAAQVAHHMRIADRYGITPTSPQVDLARVMRHVNGIVQGIYAEETPGVLRERGIDVYLGKAKFLDAHTLQVDGTILRARSFLLATGAHPHLPRIKGIDQVDLLTYESVWELTELPARLIVVGGGPVGVEIGQAFGRLGSRVTLLEAHDRLLPRDDPMASRILGETFAQEGIDVRCGSPVEMAWQAEEDIHVLAGDREITGDALLIAVGRRPNVEGLALEKSGVKYTARGITVNDRLQTSQRHIYAAGDCTGSYQFTHYAGWQAIIAARNALLPGLSKGIRRWVPWTTFTDPEIARVGLTEASARERYGDAVQTTTLPMDKVDRAHAAVDTEGVIHLVHKGSKVLGVTIVSGRAGELIHEWLHVVEGRLSLQAVATAMHVYPSYSFANVQAAGALLQEQYLGGKLGPLLRAAGRLMIKLMRAANSQKPRAVAKAADIWST